MPKNLDKLKFDIVSNFIKGDRPLSGVIMKQQWLKTIIKLSESKIVVGNAPICMNIPCSSYTAPDQIQKSKPTFNTRKISSDLKNPQLIRPFVKSKNSSLFKPQSMIQKPNNTSATRQRNIGYRSPVQKQAAKNIEKSTSHLPSHLESNSSDHSLYDFLTALDEAHLELIQSLEK